MQFAHTYKYDRIHNIINDNIESVEPGLRDIFNKYLEANGDRDAQREVKSVMMDMIKASNNKEVQEILEFEDAIVKKSQ